jgi:hypothetical protein
MPVTLVKAAELSVLNQPAKYLNPCDGQLRKCAFALGAGSSRPYHNQHSGVVREYHVTSFLLRYRGTRTVRGRVAATGAGKPVAFKASASG